MPEREWRLRQSDAAPLKGDFRDIPSTRGIPSFSSYLLSALINLSIKILFFSPKIELFAAYRYENKKMFFFILNISHNVTQSFDTCTCRNIQ